MYGNVIGFTAFDFVLRVVGRRMVGIAFPVEIVPVDFYHRAAYSAGFRIP